MGFWEQATDQAGREFGARYWRWFAAARGVRRGLPGIAVLVVAAGLIGGYLWLSPDWSAVGESAGGVASAGGRWLLITLGVVVALAVLGVLTRIGIALWRAHSWRWSRY